MIPFAMASRAYAEPGGGGGADGLNDVAAPAPSVACAFWNLFPATYSGHCLRIVLDHQNERDLSGRGAIPKLAK